MALSRKEKEQQVEELSRVLGESGAAAVFSFRTLTVADSSKLRAALRKDGGRLQVIKKRLFRRVAGNAGMPADATGSMEGSVAVAWAGDEIAPAKIIYGFVKEHEHMKVEGGLLHGTFLTGTEVERLALLPGQQELRGQLVSVLAGPLRGFAGVLSGTLRGLPGVLHAFAEKQGGVKS